LSGTDARLLVSFVAIIYSPSNCTEKKSVRCARALSRLFFFAGTDAAPMEPDGTRQGRDGSDPEAGTTALSVNFASPKGSYDPTVQCLDCKPDLTLI
jgi:hypothetical protein